MTIGYLRYPDDHQEWYINAPWPQSYPVAVVAKVEWHDVGLCWREAFS